MGHKRWANTHTEIWQYLWYAKNSELKKKKIKNRFTPSQIKPKAKLCLLFKEQNITSTGTFSCFFTHRFNFSRAIFLNPPVSIYLFEDIESDYDFFWKFLDTMYKNSAFNPYFRNFFEKTSCFFNTYFNPSLHYW